MLFYIIVRLDLSSYMRELFIRSPIKREKCIKNHNSPAAKVSLKRLQNFHDCISQDYSKQCLTFVTCLENFLLQLLQRKLNNGLSSLRAFFKRRSNPSLIIREKEAIVPQDTMKDESGENVRWCYFIIILKLYFHIFI